MVLDETYVGLPEFLLRPESLKQADSNRDAADPKRSLEKGWNENADCV